ncbi:MAG: hypothetical protein GY733_09515 [bacterium]|nr:hypothetical protein [bacterium]
MSASAEASTGEPLGLLLTDPRRPDAIANAIEGARALRFEFSSRGDRVPGRLLLPDPRSEPCPVIVAVGDAGEARDTKTLDFAARWIDRGFAIATLDLSLHGERSSAKFSERLMAALAADAGDPALDDNGCALLREFTRQSRGDIARSLDALATLPAIDTERIAMLGIGMGAALCAMVAADDSRVGAVVLAGHHPCALDDLDAQPYAERIAPRPVVSYESKTPGDAARDFFAQHLGSS